MELINLRFEPGRKKALKKSKVGMEAEFFLINNEGYVMHNAPEVINAVKKAYKSIPIVHEAGKHFIEFGCYPDVKAYNPALDMISSIEKTQELCRKKGIRLFPFSTYPGKFDPQIYEKERYRIQEKIFGTERFWHASRVAGYHIHYSLPRGVFDKEKRMIRILKKSKLSRSMIGSYNFEIAADPALTLFTQSSPFYQGVLKAKDSKMLMYRGGKKLNSPEGLYANHQQIGGMPPYKQTVTDLISSLNKRWDRWRREVEKADNTVDFEKLYHKAKLDITWGPVRINKIGTLEARGPDMNFMSLCFAVTVALKFCLRKIQREFIEVIPADFAIEEPLKFENGILYIPPHTYVRNKLQPWSAYNGHSRREMHRYAEKFFRFARSVTPRSYHGIIAPLSNMLESKESVSDIIIAYARRKGMIDNGKISDKNAAELALHYAELFNKDLQMVKEQLLKLKGL